MALLRCFVRISRKTLGSQVVADRAVFPRVAEMAKRSFLRVPCWHFLEESSSIKKREITPSLVGQKQPRCIVLVEVVIETELFQILLS